MSRPTGRSTTERPLMLAYDGGGADHWTLYVSPPTTNPLDQLVSQMACAIAASLLKDAPPNTPLQTRVVVSTWIVGFVRFLIHFLIFILVFESLFTLSDWFASTVLYTIFKPVLFFDHDELDWMGRVAVRYYRNYQGLYPSYVLGLFIACFCLLIPQARFFLIKMFRHIRASFSTSAPTASTDAGFNTQGRVPTIPAQVSQRLELELVLARHQVLLAKLAAEREAHLAEMRENEQRGQPKVAMPRPRRSRAQVMEDYVAEFEAFSEAVHGLRGFSNEEKENLIRAEKMKMQENIMDLQGA